MTGKFSSSGGAQARDRLISRPVINLLSYLGSFPEKRTIQISTFRKEIKVLRTVSKSINAVRHLCMATVHIVFFEVKQANLVDSYPPPQWA